MLMSKCNWLFLLFFTLIDTISTKVDIKYVVLRGFLRDAAERYICESEEGQALCKEQCKGVTFVCNKGGCYCHHSITWLSKTKTPPLFGPMNSGEYSEKPALRHHIAHFCENLDTARECIRTCMKQGKPAFCGKDHVCYCGHKLSSRDDVKGNDPEDTYAQFRDLYEKYFGKSGYQF